jgi:hypothetical protein
MATRRGFDRYLGAVIGWLGIVVWVAVADEASARTGRSTMSEGFGAAGGDSVVGPFVVGAWAGLCFHFLGEIVRHWNPLRRPLFPLRPSFPARAGR